ncbi:High-affinity branched-chain amino acid transport system permease protein LivH [Dehalobacter sp. UNSWDHB]|jgi:Branched-chain amino acid ABC-type transport system, permease components|uniref:branched-chain amino acid ABC transporter permease n=1 Tax=unclassified Dehalobacter TaxID=2635733 RepID=UPI00028B3936|nr:MULTISPECIES: branched-chain amino acid ABC transporter permease [unclassified Dehalobacter]AFV03597.1 High-affinity branched-chain amino acid transport system permease protein LivH [Dehalobacter sp. DCA]AFV06583.1 High-affinity branched-chain amino acid transport system permease protein LivH [Dehalobacter sp. CF]EQB20326.1 High-affinity branched-chain amino acid transport system permease protein LivH [Dehalobacter sp. UNSWDHB]
MGEQLLQLLFSGLTLGSIYSIIALILVITYKVTGILNLALGEFLVMGALLTVSFKSMGMPLIAASLLAIIIVALLAGVLERLTVNKARGASSLTMLIITIGISISLRGLALLIWGTDTYSLPSFTASGPIMAGGAALNPQSIWVFLLAAATLICVNTFFGRTYWGKAVQASVLSPIGAQLQGINLSTISLAAFVFSGALATAAGICIGPVTMVTYDMGFMLGVKGFIAATIGGLSSISGAVLGGLILGLLEAYSSGLISSGLNDAISIVILLAVLLIRPEGILGAISERKI